jgi:glycosyltransferase involved in cell wall biosynthesis
MTFEETKDLSMNQPVVSVVIPTRNRPLLVKRAVQSSLQQTFRQLEVLVIVDGFDGVTSETLAEIDDNRLRIIELETSVGGSEARNTGVRFAQGDWIAFLDDDDEWLFNKIEQQYEAGVNSNAIYPVIASQVIARTPKGDFRWPRLMPSLSEPISEYLFVRKTLFKGDALIQCSTYFTRKELLIKQPFKKELLKHQDTEWILRVALFEGVSIRLIEEPLAIWHTEQSRTTVSGKNNWKYSLNWLQEHHDLVTRKAYSSWLLTQVSAEAVQEGDWDAFRILLLEAFRGGQLRAIDLFIYFGMWLVPRKVRNGLRVLSVMIRLKSLSNSVVTQPQV